MTHPKKIFLTCTKISFFIAVFLIFSKGIIFADVTVNILAVNGTEEQKEKKVDYLLPEGIKEEDILDSAGLDIDYNIEEGRYFVHKNVILGPKETKTFKIRLRDVWNINPEVVDEIKKQIDENLDRIKDTEYYETGKIKKEGLSQRLDSVLKEQELYSANVEERINRYGLFNGEIEQIREDVLSVHFWRSKVPEARKENILDYFIEAENQTTHDLNLKNQKNYLPSEIKTEHIVNAEGFEIKYDPTRGRLYLSTEQILKPKEKKTYQIGIIDVWFIGQEKIEGLKDRTREAYKLLEKTEYVKTADYLVKNIKENLTKIEDSQSIKKPIKEHISAFRLNEKYFESAQKDVRALEDLVRAARENLERSPLKNVLQRISLLSTLAAIAAAIFGEKPLLTSFWKIIIGIIIFVGTLTIIHFTIWSKRSKGVKKEDLLEPKEEETQTKK